MADSDRANELEDRLIDFAVRINEVAHAWPEASAGKDISRQTILDASVLSRQTAMAAPSDK